MPRMLSAAVFLFAAGLCTESRAAAYDGKWLVVLPPTSVRCPSVQMNIAVANGRITEVVGTVKFTYRLAGPVAPDGTFDISSPGGAGHSKGKFSGETLAADFTNSECGTRSGTGGREK